MVDRSNALPSVRTGKQTKDCLRIYHALLEKSDLYYASHSICQSDKGTGNRGSLFTVLGTRNNACPYYEVCAAPEQGRVYMGGTVANS